ncbi:protein of unknown function [endosymbiont DhMRE of Dentiscutata heterogama]|uniref:hypothetical protein n=1 Tax=endosymbiont DhMRE of Dentiscutata heterogama TaxID=1609546 RepID=UPI000629DBCB|nr:hypothetical protein [endosymbiont DhMRE of Dentiscutata heterogama]CFW92985.1 protein of unknown function [endosymbiont DhMRE of Dentiscutata heterogama]
MVDKNKNCSLCKKVLPKIKSKYGEEGSVFNIPIGTKSEWEHNQGEWLKLCFDCWEKNKEQYKKMVDEGKICGNGYHITNSDVEAHKVNEDDDEEYDPNAPAFEPMFYRSGNVVKCNVCSKWSTEPEVRKSFHFDPFGSIDKDNACSTECGTIYKEKEELKELEDIEELTPQMLDNNQKKRLQELRKKYGDGGNNRERERERERESKNGFNWGSPWVIGGGIVIILVIGVVIYFLTRKKQR